MRRLVLVGALAAITSLMPTWAAASEQDVAQRIAGSMKSSGQLVDYNVGVQFHEGTAWLTGRVSSEDQLARALAIAERDPDVRQVVNRLEVQSVRPTAAPAVRLATPPLSGLQGSVEQVAFPADVNGPAPESREPRALAVPPTAPRRGVPVGRPIQGAPYGQPVAHNAQMGTPVMQASAAQMGAPMGAPPAGPMAYGGVAMPAGAAPAVYDQPYMPNYAWPAYAAYPNYAGVTYPRQYSPSAWPYIGPFYPYPQVPLGWRRVALEWDDGWWFLDFDAKGCQ